MSDITKQILYANSIQECLEILDAEYGFSYSAFHLTNNLKVSTDNPFVRTTYPNSWVTYYLLNNLVTVDPIIKHAMENKGPFNWVEIDPDPEEKAVMQAALEHGLGQSGYTCPCIDRNGRTTLLSVNSDMSAEDWVEFLKENEKDLMLISQDLHIKGISEAHANRQQQQLNLSPREYECLRWVSEGKTYSEISIILDLSEHTIRSYLKVARIKLDSVSLAQAVAKAHQLGLL